MRRARPPFREQSVNRLVPNMLTVMALIAGLTAIRYGLAGSWERSVVAIIIAAVCDGLDGRIARLLGGSTKFGAELDSLSDVISFGVAPSVLLYLWALNAAGGLGWTVSLLFTICCALRLARFNTKLDDTTQPAWSARFFTGVPAPVAAGLALLPMMISFEIGGGVVDRPIVVAIVMIGVAGLMVSRIPTYSFKRIKVPHHAVMPTLLGVALLIALLVSATWLTMIGVGICYLISVPFSIRAYRRLQRGDEMSPSVVPPG